MRPDRSARRVQSVETAFQILSVIQDFGDITLGELAERTDIAKSTVHNHLATLHAMGYVVKRNGHYRLGLRLLTHGEAAREARPERNAIEGPLEAAADAIELPVWWITEEVGRGIFAARAGPDLDTEEYGRIGKRSYLHAHAPGKAILAALSDEAVAWIIDEHGLPAYTTETVTDEATLRGELAQIREQGYAHASGEAAIGVQSVGVAFETPSNQVHAFGVFGYSHHFSGGRSVDRVVNMLEEHRQMVTDRV